MTLEDFIGTKPSFYGTGNSNLFYSSSVDGSDNPVAPFTISAISIPFTDLNKNNLTSPLKEVTSFKFDFGGERVETKVIGKQQKNEYVYFSLTPITVNALPTSERGSNKVELKSEFNIFPYFESDFFNSDFNPLQGNSSALLANSSAQVVDRNTSQNNPTNLQAVLDGTAKQAEIVDSFYETAGLVNGKYRGVKLTNASSFMSGSKEALTRHVLNNGISGSEPALAFKHFDGSQHPDDAITATIKTLNDRERENIYFNSEISGSGTSMTYPSFPYLGSIIYLESEDSGRFRKAASAKLYSVEQDKVFTTNISGVVTLVE